MGRLVRLDEWRSASIKDDNSFDSANNAASTTLSWTSTPNASHIAGVIVFAIAESDGTVTAVATYGGVNMPLVKEDRGTTGQTHTVLAFYLGKNVPQGPQPVVVTWSISSDSYAASKVVIADADTEIAAIATLNTQVTGFVQSPTFPVNFSDQCFCVEGWFSGRAGLGGTTPYVNWTEEETFDIGTNTVGVFSYDPILPISINAGWESNGADDFGIICLAIRDASELTPIFFPAAAPITTRKMIMVPR